jgi:CDP-glycerol glycerophosphotransferase (TagB/SpsB family)
VRDTGGADADLLVAAADLVICDYSTLIGDAALAGVPMIAFQPDRDVYVNRTHGLYPGSEAVGPVVVTMDALLDQVEAWLTDPQGWDVPYAARRAAFARDRCGPADGRSAGRAAAAMLGSSADRGRQR